MSTTQATRQLNMATNADLPSPDTESEQIPSHELGDPEKNIPEASPAFPPAPDGGLNAWLVAVGGSAIFFCCLGFANAFGDFEQYYLTHQLSGRSPDDVAWIGSLGAFLQFGSGLVGGPLFDRYGVKVVRPAAVLYLFAIMMLSLCNTYWQIMLVQGVLMGILMGMLQIPAFAAVSQYFDKKRGAAFGIVIAGSSVGGIIIPIVLSKMLNSSSLGFGWSVRIVGFLMVPFMLYACIVVKARLPPRKSNFWIMAAFKNAKFDLLIVSSFFTFFGMFIPLFFLPTYAVSRGMDATLAGYLLAILNGASTFGRVIPGMLSDKYGRLNVYALGGITSGIIIFCMDSARTTPALIVYSVFFGFTSGTIISGATTALSTCPKDPREFGAYSGMAMAIASLGVLIGPPVNAAFIDKFGGFFEVSMFSGAMCLVGGILAAVTKLTTPEGLFGRV